MLEACAFMDNGEALYYRTVPREPVEIDDEVAATLGDAVRRFDPEPEQKPDAEESPKSKRKQRKAEEPEAESEAESEAVPEENSDGDKEL
jgi:hypothetical protein